MKRPLLYRLLSCALALLVLAASIGLPVQRRTCRLSGRSTARIIWSGVMEPGRAHGGTQKLPATLASHCYAYSLELHQLSTLAPEAGAAKLLVAAPGPLALPPATFAFSLAAAAPATFGSSAAPLPFPTPPPPPGGRALLTRIGVLVV